MKHSGKSLMLSALMDWSCFILPGLQWLLALVNSANPTALALVSSASQTLEHPLACEMVASWGEL